MWEIVIFYKTPHRDHMQKFSVEYELDRPTPLHPQVPTNKFDSQGDNL
jgi:hypothetical protein